MLPLYEVRPKDLTIIRNGYDLNFPLHMHKYVEIIYAYKGVQAFSMDNKSYQINEGDAAVIFPDTIHSYDGLRNKNSDILIILCAPTLFGTLFPNLDKLHIKNPVINRSLIHDKLKTAFCMIDRNENFTANFSWTCVIMSYLMEIIQPVQADKMPVSDITYKIVHYIEEHFTEDITRQMLAKQFNVSECYISKIFSNKLKINLRNYLGLIRVEYASKLIRSTEETILTISQLAGFESLRTFNRMFHSVYGISPREYKNNIVKK